VPTDAFIGSQVLLKVDTVAVFEVTNIGEFGQETDLIEATHLASLAKEYVYGLADGVEFPVTVNYSPSDATHKSLIAAQQTRTLKAIQVVFPPPPYANSETISFSGLVRVSRVGPITANAVVNATFAIKISGAITWPA
jgi:hypothetical protein